MSYIEGRAIPRDVWYIIAQFLSYDEYLILSTFDNRLFSEDNIVYKEYYQQEVSGPGCEKSNYKDEIHRIVKLMDDYQSRHRDSETRPWKFFMHACQIGYLRMIKKYANDGTQLIIMYESTKYNNIGIFAYFIDQIDIHDIYYIMVDAVGLGKTNIIKTCIERDYEGAAKHIRELIRGAAYCGSLEMLTFLIGKYPDRKDAINQALCVAAENHAHHVIKYLVESGLADIEIEIEKNKTMSDCRDRGYTNIIDYLIEHKACIL